MGESFIEFVQLHYPATAITGVSAVVWGHDCRQRSSDMARGTHQKNVLSATMVAPLVMFVLPGQPPVLTTLALPKQLV